MNLSRKKRLLIAGAVAALLAIYFGAGAILKHRNAVVHADYRQVMTLDPALYKGPVHDAYLIARST